MDGACLPIKAYVGHCRALAAAGHELLFVPQIISVYKREYICPSFMGLPDLVKQYLPARVRILAPVIDARKGNRAVCRAYLRMGREFAPSWTVKKAWQKALAKQAEFDAALQAKITEAAKGHLNILLLGPRYLVDDHFLNGNLAEKLKNLGAGVFTAAQLPDAISRQANSVLNKRLFWTEARKSVGALEHLAARLAGVISISPFGCGAESLLGTLLAERTRARGLAKLELNIDEHTSEVGTLTRLEAFCDLLERKRMR